MKTCAIFFPPKSIFSKESLNKASLKDATVKIVSAVA